MKEHSVVLTQGPLQSFIAAGYGSLLIEICVAQGASLLSPHAVIAQIQRTARKDPKFYNCGPRLDAMVQTGELIVLGDDLDDTLLAHTYGQLDELGASSGTADVSPQIAIAHAMARSMRSLDTRLLTDQLGQRTTATVHNVDVLSSTDILLAGAQHGIVGTVAEARQIHGKLRVFNPALAMLDLKSALCDPAEYT